MVDYRQGVDLDAMGNPVDGPNLDFNPLRAEIGVEGLVTRRPALTLRGGYSNSYHEAGTYFPDQSLEPPSTIASNLALQLVPVTHSRLATMHSRTTAACQSKDHR